MLLFLLKFHSYLSKSKWKGHTCWWIIYCRAISAGDNFKSKNNYYLELGKSWKILPQTFEFPFREEVNNLSMGREHCSKIDTMNVPPVLLVLRRWNTSYPLIVVQMKRKFVNNLCEHFRIFSSMASRPLLAIVAIVVIVLVTHSSWKQTHTRQNKVISWTWGQIDCLSISKYSCVLMKFESVVVDKRQCWKLSFLSFGNQSKILSFFILLRIYYIVFY